MYGAISCSIVEWIQIFGPGLHAQDTIRHPFTGFSEVPGASEKPVNGRLCDASSATEN